jgi:hypothetical protein
MSLRQRTRRPGQSMCGAGRPGCPHGPHVAAVYDRRDTGEGVPVLQGGERLPAQCAACGRPLQVLAPVEDVDSFRRPDGSSRPSGGVRPACRGCPGAACPACGSKARS